jgi:hypothetical protein
MPAEANIIVELRTRIIEAARHCATNQGLNEKVLEMLVGSVVQTYPPEAVARELLSALWAKEHQPGQLDSLYDAICESLRELHPGSDAGLEALGLPRGAQRTRKGVGRVGRQHSKQDGGEAGSRR